MGFIKNPISTVNMGLAAGWSAVVLSYGRKGLRKSLPHSLAMIQQPRVPPTGQRQAVEVHIKVSQRVLCCAVLCCVCCVRCCVMRERDVIRNARAALRVRARARARVRAAQAVCASKLRRPPAAARRLPQHPTPNARALHTTQPTKVARGARLQARPAALPLARHRLAGRQARRRHAAPALHAPRGAWVCRVCVGCVWVCLGGCAPRGAWVRGLCVGRVWAVWVCGQVEVGGVGCVWAV